MRLFIFLPYLYCIRRSLRIVCSVSLESFHPFRSPNCSCAPRFIYIYIFRSRSLIFSRFILRSWTIYCFHMNSILYAIHICTYTPARAIKHSVILVFIFFLWFLFLLFRGTKMDISFESVRCEKNYEILVLMLAHSTFLALLISFSPPSLAPLFL